MSNRLPAVKPSKLVKVLTQKGWQLDRVRGSHHIFKHPELSGRVVVPLHGKDVKKGTLSAILDAAGITREELSRLL